ncbi:MAG: DUF3857 domain-containing protein [Pseudomonadota bacterium]
MDPMLLVASGIANKGVRAESRPRRAICNTLGVSALAMAAWSSPAFAGDEVVYAGAPDWIEPVDLAAIDRDPVNEVIVRDRQIRIETGRLWEYSDTVYSVSNLQELSSVGTLTAQWMPDKGDLIVHEVSILRDGETINVLEQGEEMEILRRERMLEMRILDGSLTATMAVPGLQVGDQLRMRYSVTTSDQALGDEVQTQSFLWREPRKDADFARVLASWSNDVGVRHQLGPDFEGPVVEQRDGYSFLEVMLPLPEAENYPYDAPLRYRRPTLLQIGTFDDWGEVSSVMAPYYDVDGALNGLDDLLERVEAIRTEYDADLERAVAALELVQEDVRYLLNGLDGGNYLPQDVATTWEKKYGDCKAKTVILLAILDELGIDAEPVLVSSSRGDAVPVSLPLPGAFDHVLVRANIDGNQYYLDGTSIGANLDVVGNVPDFRYTLPIRHAGAELEKIEQILPLVPEVDVEFAFDASAGGDLPTIGTITMSFKGAAAAQMNASKDKLTDRRKRGMGRSMGGMMGGAGAVSVLDVDIIEGNDDSEATLVMKAIMPALFDYSGSRGEFEPSLPSKSFSFSPDRSRKQWRDIPVAGAGTSSSVGRYRITLPETSETFELRGDTSLDMMVARQRFTRDVQLAGRELVITETQTSLGGEIAPEELRAERRKAAALTRAGFKVIAPNDLPRRWRFAQGADRSALEPLEAGLTKLIEEEPDEYRPYVNRAGFRMLTYDFAGALADMNSAIDLEATAQLYDQRSELHKQLLNLEDMQADLEEAYLLDPSPWRAIELAYATANLGNVDSARDLLADEDGDEEVQRSLAYAMADLDAREGNGGDGLSRLAALLDEDPTNSSLLNEKCWFMGTWQVEVGEAISVCTKAVESSDNASQVLDSRALIFLRNGMLDEALADAQAALELEPEQNETLLLRGLIRVQKGDKGGQEDIDAAIARKPGIVTDYRRWGFDI